PWRTWRRLGRRRRVRRLRRWRRLRRRRRRVRRLRRWLRRWRRSGRQLLMAISTTERLPDVVAPAVTRQRPELARFVTTLTGALGERVLAIVVYGPAARD